MSSVVVPGRRVCKQEKNVYFDLIWKKKWMRKTILIPRGSAYSGIFFSFCSFVSILFIIYHVWVHMNGNQMFNFSFSCILTLTYTKLGNVCANECKWLHIDEQFVFFFCRFFVEKPHPRALEKNFMFTTKNDEWNPKMTRTGMLWIFLCMGQVWGQESYIGCFKGPQSDPDYKSNVVAWRIKSVTICVEECKARHTMWVETLKK